MKDYRKIELGFIIALIALSLIIGIYCSISFPNNTVPSGVCFAIGITSLVYWFLGGISSASFNIGYLKLGGSIAALLGSFYLINKELENSIQNHAEFRVIESKYLLDLETYSPAEIQIQIGADTNLISSKTFSLNKFAGYSLKLDSNLVVRAQTGVAVGSLKASELQEKDWYKSIQNSSDPGELFTFSLGQQKSNQRIDLAIQAKVFRADERAEMLFTSISNKALKQTVFIKNKGMQVLRLGKKYYMVSATQADFEQPIQQQFIQIFVKPLDVK